MARKERPRQKNREEQQPTRNSSPPTSRKFKHWRIIVIMLLLLLVALTAGLLKHYKSSDPRECYYCTWIAKPNATTLSDHPCGRDQRNPNSTVKKCNSHQQFCGSLHVSLSYKTEGVVKKVDFAFIRDCFTEYPLKYVMNIDKSNRTYYGGREGNVYPNISGRGINMTVVGKQCSDWNLCNSNHPKVNSAASFFDSVTIFKDAKEAAINTWSSLIEFISEAKLFFDNSQTAV